MELRKTEPKDIQAVADLFQKGREALKAAGVDQWQGDSPSGEDARRDMENGVGYVLVEEGQVVAAACLAFGVEPTYNEIDGAWGYEGEYGFIHRVAVDPAMKGKGAASLFFRELERQARSQGIGAIRGDTHRDNQPMQRVMAKNGLSFRGVIHLEDGSERLAFEKVL